MVEFAQGGYCKIPLLRCGFCEHRKTSGYGLIVGKSLGVKQILKS